MTPKRYRLKKDLPTFRAGEIFVLENAIEQQGLFRESDGIMAYHQGTLEKFPNILTDWFEEIKDEPLIRDEDIRKVVRAWARVNGEEDDRLRYYSRCNRLSTASDCIEFSLFTPFITLEDGKDYTIDELCGEATDEA